MITEGRYTFHTDLNSPYFQGANLQIDDDETRRAIIVNIKDDMWAVEVKDDIPRRNWPADVQTAADEIDDSEVEHVYETICDDFWSWASCSLPSDHGFETAEPAGRSAGWLAVPGSCQRFPEIIEPSSPEAREARDGFLALAFEAVEQIDAYYRPELYAALKRTAAAWREESEIMEAFVRGYQTCALWSSNDPDTELPLDDTYMIEDIDDDTDAKMRAECGKFVTENRADLNQAVELLPERDWASMGHDFWLTRNGHGAGFWDRATEAPPADRGKVKPILDRLSKASREAGERTLFVSSADRVGEG